MYRWPPGLQPLTTCILPNTKHLADGWHIGMQEQTASSRGAVTAFSKPVQQLWGHSAP